MGNSLDTALTKAKLNAIAQNAKQRVAGGDIVAAIKGAMDETALQLIGYARPPLLPNPRRAWGLSLFFFGSAGIAFMGVYRFW